MSANGTLLLPEVRAKAAQALAPAAESDPVVLADLVDSVQPPALMLEWADPWVTVRSLAGGQGLLEAQMNVLCLAGRLEPGPGIAMLEQLVDYAITRLATDDYSWPLTSTQAPRVFEIANVPLLGARLSYRVPIRMGGTA